MFLVIRTVDSDSVPLFLTTSKEDVLAYVKEKVAIWRGKGYHLGFEYGSDSLDDSDFEIPKDLRVLREFVLFRESRWTNDPKCVTLAIWKLKPESRN